MTRAEKRRLELASIRAHGIFVANGWKWGWQEEESPTVAEIAETYADLAGYVMGATTEAGDDMEHPSSTGRLVVLNGVDGLEFLMDLGGEIGDI